MKKFIFSILSIAVAGQLIYAQELPGEKYLGKELPDVWIADTAFVYQSPLTGRWWLSLEDDLLDSLIAVAFVNSPDLRTVFYRTQAAHAALRMQQSDYYPSLNLSFGWNKKQSSGRVGGAENTSRDSYFSGSLSSSWEIDLFGSTYNKVRSQKALYRASVEEYNAALVSLAAQVASAYARLRMLQQELEVAQENIASQQSILEITETRYRTGLTSQLDVAQARSVYYSTLASVPSLEASIVVQTNVVALLVGAHPHEIYPLLQPVGDIPDFRMIIPVGVPANLLRQRPDIRAAEQSLVSTAALLGAARAEYMPHLTLNGSIGFASEKIGDFFNRRSLVYEIAPSISWTLFQGRYYAQATKQARAQLEIAVEQYNLAVLTAIEEVDNAMITYKGALRQLQTLEELVSQGELTLNLSLDLYKQGLTTFQNVLDAQRSLLTYQNGLVTSQGSALSAVIDLYRALGGGWDTTSND